jgi:ABC-type glycerol-3-phosphate transport system permease component
VRTLLRRSPTYLLLVLGAVLTFGPFYWMVVSSFKPQSEIFTSVLTPLPTDPTLEHYRSLLGRTPFLRWTFNSIVFALGTTFLSLFFSTLAGFAFAKYEFRGKRVLFAVVLASVSIPQFVTIIPVYGLMVKLGLTNTYLGLILPFSVNALVIFLMRQYILGIPSELLDAARIDGSSEFGLFHRVIVPVIRPAIGAAGIFVFLTTWNQYLWPLIMAQSNDMMVAPVGLATLRSLYVIEYGQIMAGATLSTLPILLLFVLMQQQFVAGLTSGALKG